MTDFSKKILEIINSRNGIKAVEIANILNCDKSLVNSALYSAKELKGLCVQDSKYYWYPMSAKTAEKKKTDEKADEKLRKICRYYLNCISNESTEGINSFLTSKFDLPYVEVAGIRQSDLYTEEVSKYLLKHNSMKHSANYIGYPIYIDKFTSKAGEVYYKQIPIFLFNVLYSGGSIEVDELPTINSEILKKYSDNFSGEILQEQLKLEEELGLSGDTNEIEIDEIAMRLQNIRNWEWKENLDPNNICMEVPIYELRETGIYNRAVIISTEKAPYTVGLESELLDLSKKTTDEIKGTALYDWLNGFTEKNFEIDNNILEVLPLNIEQTQAVSRALTQKTTIVTGPPGTGKSQVVTDIIVNMAYQGKNVLFSSKNNKAVDVVYKRVNGLANKPIMIRVGGSAFANELAELVENILSGFSSEKYRHEFQILKERYECLSKEKKDILDKKKSIVEIRNNVDKLENDISEIDNDTRAAYLKLDYKDNQNIINEVKKYVELYNSAVKENQDFFTRLFWHWEKNLRADKLKLQANVVNELLKKINLSVSNEVISGFETMEEMKKIKKAVSNISKVQQYSNELTKLNETSLEECDKKLYELSKRLKEIASQLWIEWINTRCNNISSSDREKMASYLSAIKLLNENDVNENPTIKSKFKSLQATMTKYLPCWAVASLSAKGRIPLTAGMFDLLIIDEASQCDIASILPLLYRSKRSVIIGDPKQLSHISSIPSKLDATLINKYDIEFKWAYTSNSLYNLAQGMVNSNTIVRLKDHHRCFEDIVEFSNKEFYEGMLRVATDYSKLVVPKEQNPGIRWIDIAAESTTPPSGSCYNIEEARSVVNEIKKLIDNDYKGSIGVVTPFKLQADTIRKLIQSDNELYKEISIRYQKEPLIVDTVHKFQGDERDLIIFSTVISNNSKNGAITFLQRTGNLFNVAITRARSMLIVVGNQGYCAKCDVGYMERFVKYYQELNNKSIKKSITMDSGKTREYPEVANAEQVSKWEKDFYTALFDAGIQTIPQFPEDKYKLDLAIIIDDRKLDIEIDGEMYHKTWNGELCYRDQLRNQRLIELGWDIRRFWVYQIRDQMDMCISEIKKWINN